MHQTNIKTWLVDANVERLSETSVYNDEASALHAVRPSLRGTFCIERSRLWPRLTYLPEKETCLDSPPFQYYFPTLHTQQIAFLEQYLLIYLPKKKLFTFTESDCSQNPPLRFIMSQF
jgi:hypothetical protein